MHSESPPPLTVALARFVSELTLRDIPEAARAVARTGMADCFAVMVAGSSEPLVDLVRRQFPATHEPTATLFPSGGRRSVADAALINGVSAHILDYDDVTLDGHPSAVLLPAILAAAEASGSSGAEMVTAYVAGYELWAELVQREPTPLHEKGWHPTTVRGTLAAATAAARLRRLDAGKLANALGIAASMAGGIVANFGTQTKAFQVGRAAEAGVTAASLAAEGMTAATDALEHPAGFLAAFSPNRNADTDSRPLRRQAEQDWHIVRAGLNIKRYPMCYAVHRAVDATLALIGPNQLRPQDIAEVRVFTGDVQVVMLRNPRPQTPLEAKFSMPFAIASAVIAGNAGLEQLTDAFVTSADVQSFFARVSCETTTDRLEGSAFAPFDRVEIRTTGGITLKSEPVRYAKGSYRNPLSRDEFWVKFADCLGDKIPRANQEPLFSLFLNLERTAGVAEIVALASASRAPGQ